MVPRRSPGQRRRRTRREEELEQLEKLDPAKHAELLELRRYNPQAYRKALAKLIKRGVISKGRAFEVQDDALSALSLKEDELCRALDAGIERGDYNFRTLAGLLQQERNSLARKEVLAWLERRYAELLASEGRALK
jgi:hypothetical protein